MQTFSEEYALWKRHARSRPGMTLVGIEKVAIPVTLVRVEVVAQEKKSLDLLDEFVLRMNQAGLSHVSQIAETCGLEEVLIRNVVMDLVSGGSLQYHHQTDSLSLTPMGLTLVEELVEIKPVVSEFPVTFDRLTWSLTDYAQSNLIAKGRARDSCYTLMPAAFKTRPGASEISPVALNTVLRFKWPKELTVLEVRKIKPNTYRYLPAELLVFRGETNDDISVSLTMDGESSGHHDLALAQSRTQDLLDVIIEEPAISDSSQLPILGLELIKLDDSHPIFAASAKRLKLDPCLAEVQGFEHHELLMRALATAETRVLIGSTTLSGGVIDEHFLRMLDQCLKRKLPVDLMIGGAVDNAQERRALKNLRDLQASNPRLGVHLMGDACENVLIFDQWWVVSSFNWLGHRGRRRQIVREHYGFLLGGTDHVDDVYRSHVSLTR